MSVSFDVLRSSAGGRVYGERTVRALQNNEVLIDITHSGLCGTDELFFRTGQALGHEGVGIVREIGSQVKSVQVGDRVGFGYVRKVCGVCDNCTTGWDQFCREGRVYGECDHDIGSFASSTVWDADNLFLIPDGYGSEDAATLMCAGATAWESLRRFDARPSDRVAIVGMGGLGHLAIQIAAAMGSYVVVFSSTNTKREDAIRLGASEFHVLNVSQDPAIYQPVNHLLLCGKPIVDFSTLISLMDTNSTIHILAVSFETAPIPLLPLVLRGIRIQGSRVASRQHIRDLLEFAHRKRITADVVVFPMSKEGLETAMQKLRDGDIRYKAVLVRDFEGSR